MQTLARQPSLAIPFCTSSPLITGMISTAAFTSWNHGSENGTMSDGSGMSNTTNAVLDARECVRCGRAPSELVGMGGN
jgi:hypothetical protein